MIGSWDRFVNISITHANFTGESCVRDPRVSMAPWQGRRQGQDVWEPPLARCGPVQTESVSTSLPPLCVSVPLW